jgi:hypothetical protein
MARIESGVVTAFFLFDVAETIQLEKVRNAAGAAARDTRFTTRMAAPVYVQYNPPPIALSGQAIGIREIEGFSAAFKVYEYGVISVALTMDFRGDWTQLVAFAGSVMGSDRLESGARRAVDKIVDRIRDAAVDVRGSYLSEDYYVIGVRQLDQPLDAATLLKEHGHDIAQLLRSETRRLSAEERDEVLRHHLSYLADDVLVVTWQAAFVYDAEDLQAALEIVEFANSQLLQFRYYDDLLDTELTRIYAQVQNASWRDSLIGGRYTKAAHRLLSLFIDVNEITDRTENALKMVGDIYAARVLQLSARRIGVDSWRFAVEEKLKTLDSVYRFIVEEMNMARGHFLELTIVAILLFELALFFMGIMT